jgi:hypothetical protein
MLYGNSIPSDDGISNTPTSEQQNPLNCEQLHILQHSLGLDQYGRGEIYRNHFCAGGKDESVCRSLVALGFMREHRQTELFPYYNCSVTEAGKEAVRKFSPKPPKLTRSQRRYRAFLDHDCGLSFREWLKYYGSEVRP